MIARILSVSGAIASSERKPAWTRRNSIAMSIVASTAHWRVAPLASGSKSTYQSQPDSQSAGSAASSAAASAFALAADIERQRVHAAKHDRVQPLEARLGDRKLESPPAGEHRGQRDLAL